MKKENNEEENDQAHRRDGRNSASETAQSVDAQPVRCSDLFSSEGFISESEKLKTELQFSYAQWAGVSPYGQDDLSRKKFAILSDLQAQSRKLASEPD